MRGEVALEVSGLINCLQQLITSSIMIVFWQIKQSNQEEAWTGEESQDQDRPWVLEGAEAFEGGEVAFFLSAVAMNRV